MKQGPKLEVRQRTRLSPAIKIALGTGIGIAAGALLALLIVKTEFNAKPGVPGLDHGDPQSPELVDPPILRRPPPVEKGNTLRMEQDTSSRMGRTVQSLR